MLLSFIQPLPAFKDTITNFFNSLDSAPADLLELITNYILTLLAMAILQKKFSDKKEEFKMILKKAKKWSSDVKKEIKKREGEFGYEKYAEIVKIENAINKEILFW